MKQRLLVILSDVYLKSENCLRELHDVGRESTFDCETFMERIRVFRLDDADIIKLHGQLAIQEYWKAEFESLQSSIGHLGIEPLAPEQLARFRRIADFARNAGQMLDAICDRFFPGSFDEFVEHGFAE